MINIMINMLSILNIILDVIYTMLDIINIT